MVKTVNKYWAKNCPADMSDLKPDMFGIRRIYSKKLSDMSGPPKNFLLNFHS
jgi:hypothetical protein